ncbi:hypothetical protein J2Z40_001228 [Cytobacillus eiseniae]|uniref:Uncharacterized protein n=1 Tax=Cytobacillus eiseniae TaxID=762947 RepID=A0ABS4RE73_9BACI|nr:hypothetical protein [Cytobacillus eiseniae]
MLIRHPHFLYPDNKASIFSFTAFNTLSCIFTSLHPLMFIQKAVLANIVAILHLISKG